MIRKIIGQMLAAQTLSALTVSLCLLIDNIMIGRFLGVNSLAAYGLANPILLFIGALGSMLSAGVQVICSKSLGRGSQEETNAGYSSAIVITLVFSAAFLLVVMLLRVPLAQLLGAHEPALLEETSDYMAGFIIGAPASMGALILVPFLQIAGKSNLLIAAVLGMTVADVGFDLLNVTVFHAGMFGMGLASSLSYYIAVIIGIFYFISKKCVFRFSLRLVKKEKIKELFLGGVPTVVGMIATLVMVFVMNKILLPVGGTFAVAAFSVINTLGSASNCISTGSGGVSLTLSGILYHEEDKTGLKDLIRVMTRYAAMLGIAVTVLLLIFAPYCVRLFIPNDVQTQALAITGLRFYALGLTPCCINNAFRSCYQGTERIRLMEVISVIENALLPIAAALILSSIFGIHGAWLFFAAGEFLTLFGIFAHVWIKNKKVSRNLPDILMLSDSFGVAGQDLLEADIENLEDVMEFSRSADAFCLKHSKNSRIGNHLALCIEEMGSNIVQYGFTADKRRNHLSIRLQYKVSRWILRFRDDCSAFNPLDHIPGPDDQDNLGILLAMRMADEARYTYSMNLNNLMLVLMDEGSA